MIKWLSPILLSQGAKSQNLAVLAPAYRRLEDNE